MPSKSPAQARLMRARAHGWKPDRIKGPSVKVAKEFVAADKKAKGYQRGGITARRLLKEARDKRTPEERSRERYGTEPLTLKQAMKRVGSVRGGFRARGATATRELRGAGWTQSGEKWYPPQATAGAPGGLGAATAPPARTIDPVPGREFISGAAPPRRVGPPARTAADVAPGFRPGRVPSALLAYLESARAAAGEEPVKMQFGGAMRGMMQRGRRGRRGMRGRGQPPGGGGLARAAVMPGSAPGPQRGQSPIQGFIDRGGIQGRQLRRPGAGGGVGQGQPRPQPPGAGVPLRGVGRPPGMGRPGAGGNVQADVMPGRGFTPGGGGAGTPGGANRIGMGDQQGAQARAMQVQTGRPPMSRRQPFPGRSRRSRGRFR